VRPSQPVVLDWQSDLTMDNARNLIPEINSDDDVITSSDARHAVGEVISDRCLNQAIGACCTDDKGHFLVSRPVRELIVRYAPIDRPTMNAIPQDQRRQFLTELATTTGRALPPTEPIRAEPTVADLVLQQIANASEPIQVGPASASQDARLIANGYEPVAVIGKAAVGKGWTTRPSTIEAVTAERADHPVATNTGLRTGRLVGVDIDIIPAEHVQAVKHLAVEVLGDASFERVGAKGAMLCYRNETPLEKITVSGKHPTKAGKVEILGTGQHFVGYGVHPDTRKPYIWTNALLDRDPLETPLDKLPEVTPDKLRDFAERAGTLMASLGYTDVKVSGRGEAAERVHLDTPVNLEVDAPANIERARTWLRSLVDRGDVAVEGEGGDNRAYQVACGLRDLGLSAKTAWEVLLEPGGWNEHCDPPWKRNELAVKVCNAYKYGKNAPGVLAASFFPPELPQLEAVEATTSSQPDKLVERFRGRWPDEYEALPELSFWDDDKTLPRCPDGCIAIVYGEFGAHKTNTVLAMALDAVLDENARVCYAAGEGAHGVGKHRIPAHCAARGIPTKVLRGRLRIVPAVPLFAAADEVAAFIEAQQDFSPNIVVLDTLATAIAGEDENSSRAAAFLTANGPAGLIRDAFKALVILPAHQGKDAGKKVRGHSGFMGNTDVVLHVEVDKKAGAIKVTVEKMRDGRDGFSIFFKVPPAGSASVPVPVKITEEEYLGLMGTTSARPSDAQLTFNQRRGILVDQGAVSFDRGLPEPQFAEILAGPRPRDGDVEGLATWQTQVSQERTALKNAHRKKHYEGVLCSERVPTGGKKMQWRWYIVHPEAADTRPAALEAPVDPNAIFGCLDHGGGMPFPAGASAAGYPS
jgi:AAA domain/Bifunctional DNA primase/polymerase, N-terminal